MSDARTTKEADGPVAQSVAIGFRALYLGVAIMAALWLSSNVRQVPPDSQAVIQTFGAITGVRQSGLVLSWPRPIGEVVLVPGADRLLSLSSEGQAAALNDDYAKVSGAEVPPGSNAFLTGDGGVVLLAATFYYHVSDAAAYLLSSSHVAPALQRVFQAGAVTIAAARPLDDFLVATPDRAADPLVASRREAVRGDLMTEMNRRLAVLAAEGANLGVEIGRIDLQAALPPQAKLAFDDVLAATQKAEQMVAAARTDATHTRQEGDRERDRVLTAARAAAAEWVSEAQTKTAAIVAVHERITEANRPGVMDQVYRDRLAQLMHQAGTVTAVDARGGARIILPGTKAIPGVSQ